MYTLGHIKEFHILQPFPRNLYPKWISWEPGIEAYHVLNRLWGLNIGHKIYCHASTI